MRNMFKNNSNNQQQKVINYMNKSLSPIGKTFCLTHRNSSLQKPKISFKLSDSNSIASLKQAEVRIKKLEDQHRWRKERRLKALHQTYDENCRLYMSINNQKSAYSIKRIKPVKPDLSILTHKKYSSNIKRYETEKERTIKLDKTQAQQKQDLQILKDSINVHESIVRRSDNKKQEELGCPNIDIKFIHRYLNCYKTEKNRLSTKLFSAVLKNKEEKFQSLSLQQNTKN